VGGAPRTELATKDAWSTGAVDDAELVALAQVDPQAFALLYRRYVNPIHRYCYRRLGNREASEDATSLVFTKAFASLPSFRSGSFRSWLFAIAYYVITDDFRGRRAVTTLDMASDVPDHGPSPEEVVMLAEASSSVVRLLGQLPESQRRVIELRLAGLTGREVSDVLGCSLGAVKIAQVRGYSRLRGLFINEVQEAQRDGDE
jgi:RNA polymerase sigma-70 factor (ECF subfamily)